MDANLEKAMKRRTTMKNPPILVHVATGALLLPVFAVIYLLAKCAGWNPR